MHLQPARPAASDSHRHLDTLGIDKVRSNLLALALLPVLTISWAFTAGSEAQAAVGPDFTLVTLPDTQFYAENADGQRAATFSAQTKWIAEHRESLNIAFVSHMGDVVNSSPNPAEWAVADAALAIIENPALTAGGAGIPWGVAPGNHDLEPYGDATGTHTFERSFGVSRFAGRSYYGGHFAADNANNYQLFSAGGLDFIILHLQYDKRPLASYQPVLDWADALLTAHSQRRAIVTSHWMINTGNPASFSAQGQAIYDALKHHPNLFLLLGGHVAGEGRRTDTFEGHTVYSILQDYQSRANGGDGWLRYYTFSPANNTISARTYQVASPLNPVSAGFETTAESQFSLAYNMQPVSPAAPPSTTANTTATTANTTANTAATAAATVAKVPTARYVIVISVDGMGSAYVKPLLQPGLTNELTTFKRIQAEGTGTLNARDDADFAITLPNHTTMMTGRGVLGPTGHNWTTNTDPPPGATFESNKGAYVSSAFDVIHDHGLRTGIWSGKSKFRLFHTSYGPTTGAPDITVPDHGRDKIDCEKITAGVPAADLTADFVRQMTAQPINFAFFHYQDPDAAGHSLGWSTDPASPYAASLKSVDTQIGKILDLVRASPALNGKTTIILTSDHGGHEKTHGDTHNPLDYTIPFYVWSAGVTLGSDLYAIKPTTRSAPAAAPNPPYS
ncbi:MAG: alkaline phosphatase family protein, partial [Verrucomicrobiota bacterium]